jgi:hypothetical protein
LTWRHLHQRIGRVAVVEDGSSIPAFAIDGAARRESARRAAVDSRRVVIRDSPVRIGTHYVGDVLGGAATGFLAAWLVWSFYDRGTRLDFFLTRIF